MGYMSVCEFSKQSRCGVAYVRCKTGEKVQGRKSSSAVDLPRPAYDAKEPKCGCRSSSGYDKAVAGALGSSRIVLSSSSDLSSLSRYR